MSYGLRIWRKSMRTHLLFATLALSLCAAACSKNPKDRLQGKWLGDSVANVAPDQNAAASAWVKGMSFEFVGDKLTVTVPAEQPRVGEYKVDKVDGKNVTLKITRDSGTVDTANLLFAEDRSLHWDIGDGREVILTRLQ